MKKTLLFTLLLFFVSRLCANEVVELKRANTQKGKQFEIPVHVDVDHSLLGIHFKKAHNVFVSVLGPDGVAYQREVTSDAAKSIYVDMTQYQEGEYTIYLQDAKGNALEGDFKMEKE